MNLNFFEYTLASGESARLAARGRLIRGVGADERYQIRLDDGALTDFETGIAFESPQFFERVEIVNTAAASQKIRIAIADGYVDDNRLVGQIDINGGIRQAGNRSASYGAESVSTTAVEISAANPNRGNMLLQPQDGDIFVGTDASVTVSNGIKVAAGSSASFTLQTAIFAIAAAAVDVRYLEESL
jgi:hypothetical protein